jgi:hypothetical protein
MQHPARAAEERRVQAAGLEVQDPVEQLERRRVLEEPPAREARARERHLSNAYRKLGIGSRTELAIALRRD